MGDFMEEEEGRQNDKAMAENQETAKSATPEQRKKEPTEQERTHSPGDLENHTHLTN